MVAAQNRSTQASGPVLKPCTPLTFPGHLLRRGGFGLGHRDIQVGEKLSEVLLQPPIRIRHSEPPKHLRYGRVEEWPGVGDGSRFLDEFGETGILAGLTTRSRRLAL